LFESNQDNFKYICDVFLSADNKSFVIKEVELSMSSLERNELYHWVILEKSHFYIGIDPKE